MIDAIHLVGILHTMQLPSPASRRWWDEAAVELSQEAGNGGDEVCGESFYSQTKTKNRKRQISKTKIMRS